MISNSQELFSIFFLIYFLTYEPIVGFIMFRKFSVKQKENPNEKAAYYYKTLAGLWLNVICCVIFLIYYGIPLKAVGISTVTLRVQELNKWFVWAVVAVATIFFLLIVYQLIATRVSSSYRQKLMETKLPEEVSILLPQTNHEKKLWTAISISAGLTEEFLYRGFLTVIITGLFPGFSHLVIAIACSVIFGLGHTYQGLSGVIKTGLLGLFFYALFLSTGSVIPGMLLHFIIDFSAKDLQATKGNFHTLN